MDHRGDFAQQVRTLTGRERLALDCLNGLQRRAARWDTPGICRLRRGPALALTAAAAMLIGGVQATESFGYAGGIYHTLEVFFTRTLAWFAVLYLVVGAVVTLEERRDRAPG